MSLDYRIIGERLKQARNNKNLTQEQLAEVLDVSIAYLSRIERGDALLNLKRLSQICEVLDITEGEILNGSAPNSKSYLSQDFSNLIKTCPPEKLSLIYDIAKLIANN